MKVNIFTDGGARGNPGPAAVGVVIKNEQEKTIKEAGAYIGKATNNEAEYTALLLGLRTAKELGATQVQCSLDSELVVKQLRGEYRTKNGRLAELAKKVRDLEKTFSGAVYIHITRNKNKRADYIVNKVLDSQNE